MPTDEQSFQLILFQIREAEKAGNRQEATELIVHCLKALREQLKSK